jgi:transposase
MGLLLNVVVHPADVQDRDGALGLLRRARRLFPFIERIFADGGYAGRKMALVVWRTGTWKLQVVKRSAAAGFEVLTEAVDRRTHLRLDQPQPPPCARLRALCLHRRRLHPPCNDPHHAQEGGRKSLTLNPNLSDGL